MVTVGVSSDGLIMLTSDMRVGSNKQTQLCAVASVWDEDVTHVAMVTMLLDLRLDMA